MRSTESILVRRFTGSDAESFHAAVRGSIEALERWLIAMAGDSAGFMRALLKPGHARALRIPAWLSWPTHKSATHTTMKFRPLIGLCLAASSIAMAAPVPAAVKAEIDALLSSLSASGCQFNRNGTWHTASQARDHLLSKLEYLEGKNAVTRTEDFIALAASSSSSTGKAYLVQCAGASPVDSKSWMLSRLKSVRNPAGAASAAR